MEMETLETLENVNDEVVKKAAEEITSAITEPTAIVTTQATVPATTKGIPVKNIAIGAGLTIAGVGIGYSYNRWIEPALKRKFEEAKAKRAAKKAEKAAKKAEKAAAKAKKPNDTPAPEPEKKPDDPITNAEGSVK